MAGLGNLRPAKLTETVELSEQIVDSRDGRASPLTPEQWFVAARTELENRCGVLSATVLDVLEQSTQCRENAAQALSEGRRTYGRRCATWLRQLQAHRQLANEAWVLAHRQAAAQGAKMEKLAEAAETWEAFLSDLNRNTRAKNG
jgi:ParB-like chromosome segregation protein Spo0J